jgi:hypothetical protein
MASRQIPSPSLALPRAVSRGLSHGPLALALIALSALLARVFMLGQPIAQVDEAFYLLVGERIVEGALPYVDIWDRKPPGLFLIYAAIRLLGGNGVIQYQLVALAFTVATAWVIRRIALPLAGPAGATLAGVFYVWWTALCGGAGGQSPVFYNLLVALAGLVVSRLVQTRDAPEHLVWRGVLAMLAAGVALEIKPSVVVEGLFLGLSLMWVALRTRSRLEVIALGALWAGVALMPFAAAAGFWAWRGHFGEFAYATLFSINGRGALDPAESLYRLCVSMAMVAPLYAFGALQLWRGVPPADRAARDGRVFVLLWTAASVGAVWLGAFGAIFEHYLLPTLVPACCAAAPVLARWRDNRLWIALTGLAAAGASWAIQLSDRAVTGGWATVRAADLATRGQRNCPFVFEGPPALIQLDHWCAPTAWPFPIHLSYLPERDALGVDVAGEIARVLATRPDRILIRKTAPHGANPGARAQVQAVIERDYELVADIEPDGLLVWRLRPGLQPLPNDVMTTPHLQPRAWP